MPSILTIKKILNAYNHTIDCFEDIIVQVGVVVLDVFLFHLSVLPLVLFFLPNLLKILKLDVNSTREYKMKDDF
jgi:hypothetical protein